MITSIASKNLLSNKSNHYLQVTIGVNLAKNVAQVEALALMAACTSGDLDGYLAAVGSVVRFMFGCGIHHYSHLMPLHILEMKEI